MKVAPGTTQKIDDPESKLGFASESAYVFDHQAERALCRKFDFRLLPVLACMYLFNSLDKGNLGNAKTDGMEKDLGFKSNQYNIILSVFYIPYVLCALPIVSSFRFYFLSYDYFGGGVRLLASCQYWV